MKKLLIVLMLLPLTSCKKTPCEESELVHKTSERLSVLWECKNPEALDKWITKIASKVGVCEEVEQKRKEGVVAMLVCPLLAKGAQRLLYSQVPKEAECNPDKVGAGVASAFNFACQFIPY